MRLSTPLELLRFLVEGISAKLFRQPKIYRQVLRRNKIPLGDSDLKAATNSGAHCPIASLIHRPIQVDNGRVSNLSLVRLLLEGSSTDILDGLICAGNGRSYVNIRKCYRHKVGL
ncbi:unnamed protein product [Nezara viridula]|uniref:Uncharacterized protein n=1 Tax=Nezara viridula TaxID=85310 RepID=A0A9P0HMD1_NEZVI|nr:unnamed protein product [Nezara viridula]